MARETILLKEQVALLALRAVAVIWRQVALLALRAMTQRRRCDRQEQTELAESLHVLPAIRQYTRLIPIITRTLAERLPFTEVWPIISPVSSDPFSGSNWGCTQTPLYGWEKSERRPSARVEKRIIAFLGCDPLRN